MSFLSNVFFGIFIMITIYVVVINLALIYGLKKAARKPFGNPQLLQFALAIIDVAASVYISIFYFYLQENESLSSPILRSIGNVLFLWETFILALIVFSRYMTIRYPFRNNKISKFVARKSFLVASFLFYTLAFTFFEMYIYERKDYSVSFYYAFFDMICFLLMVIFNILSIVTLKTSSIQKINGSRTRLERQKRAVHTLSLVTISMLIFSLPNMVGQQIYFTQFLKQHGKEMPLLPRYAKYLTAFFMLGMGVNSNIFLCRSSEIMKLMKEIILTVRRQKLNIKEKLDASISLE